MKLNVGVIFGGRGLEHEMSIISAIQAMDNIDSEKYNVIPIFITKDRDWYTGGCLKYIDTYKDLDLLKRYSKRVNLINKDGRYILQTNGIIKREVCELHLAFPIMYGAYCGDGTIQGYLSAIGIPYVGSNIYSSAVSQDKVFVKQILEANNIPVTKFVWFGERFYRNKKEELFKQIDKLSYPLILKPASLGSSIGIEMITQKEEIDSTIERGFNLDTKILIEEMIEDAIEYNCSVLLTPNGNITSEIEQITTNKDIRNYADKFIYEDSKESSIRRICPAKISDKLKKEIEFNSLAIFKLLNMRGTARIDFLYDKKKDKLYVAEVNSLPFCFSHHLWESINISYRELLNIMLQDAIDNEVKLQKMSIIMENDIINKMTNKTIKEMK